MIQINLLKNISLDFSGHLQFGNLHGSSLALLCAQLTQQNNQRPTVLITPDNLTATRLAQALTFFAPEISLLNFPDWETLPYDNFSPHQDIVAERLLTLSKLPQLKHGILIVPITTLLQRITPQQFIDSTTFNFAIGDKIHLEKMRLRLQQSGYRCVAQVLEHGEFAVRGSILDLFPSGSDLPLRIDLFDDEIDSIRTFDPDTQRSIETVDRIRLLPAREFPLTDEAITLFRQQWREKFSGNPVACSIYQDVSQGFTPPGIEYYLPLFFSQTQTLFDYLPNESLMVRVGDIHQAAQQFWQELNERFEQGRYDVTRPLLEPHELYLRVEDLFNQLKNFAQIYTQDKAVDATNGKYNFATTVPPALTINHKAEQPLQALQNFLSTHENWRILFCTETAGRREVLIELLKNSGIDVHETSNWQDFLNSSDHLTITVAPLDEGLLLEENSLAVITESELFGQQVLQRRQRKAKQYDPDTAVRNLAELTIGAAVVHIDHGVGRYLGLQTISHGETQAEYLMLSYSGDDKLYVPVSSLHLISRYSGSDNEHAPLHRLGSEQWDKAKRKAAEQVNDVAVELLDLYARRAARQGFAFNKPEMDYLKFAAGFPFEETYDQQQAIQHVINDMTSGKPMDRLVCGDVGFGKTEVAMRAAFVAVQNNKQVVILVPTTLLAQQHFQNFQDRFADWPIKVEMVSRFRSAAEQKAVLERVKIGSIDILIGTHRLLQDDVQFKNLGLVIIDEEHRFGVQQKEKLKSLRAEVDILALTATPIPRTLNMALSHLREFSIIATPPARRLSIKTFVRERNKNLIREAILRELLRGGQVYLLHNEVQTIENVAQEIAELVPEARVNVAHGQMRERELEKIMADFYHHRFNVLICTTIIETGIDIPTANTIIIERADKFGLAQLHQLRGRVGRSHHQAYAYLMTPNKKSMTADAVKRLDAISALEDLGAGFTLAMHDLEIRGAGEILGEEQSGDMQAIGFSLYMEMLEQAVEALKSGKQPMLDQPLKRGSEIDLQITALIPEIYIPDINIRLLFYKRIANAIDTNSLKELQVEMIDRFGLLPDATKNLFAITELKLVAQPLGIKKIDASAQGGRLDFDAVANIDPVRVIQLVQKCPNHYKLEGPQRLRFFWKDVAPESRVEQVKQVLELLK